MKEHSERLSLIESNRFGPNGERVLYLKKCLGKMAGSKSLVYFQGRLDFAVSFREATLHTVLNTFPRNLGSMVKDHCQ